MAGEFFKGLGQTVAGGLATAATLGMNDDVINMTREGAGKMADNAEKAWGADGEVTKFVENAPGKSSSPLSKHQLILRGNKGSAIEISKTETTRILQFLVNVLTIFTEYAEQS